MQAWENFRRRALYCDDAVTGGFPNHRGEAELQCAEQTTCAASKPTAPTLQESGEADSKLAGANASFYLAI